jgi:hypothetical protein
MHQSIVMARRIERELYETEGVLEAALLRRWFTLPSPEAEQ